MDVRMLGIHKVILFIFSNANTQFLGGNLGHLHLYIPATILIIINIVLFVKTILYFLKTKRDLKKISDYSTTKTANMKKANKK